MVDWALENLAHHSSFRSLLEGSQVRYNVDYGAQLVTIDDACLNTSFYNRDGDLIDSHTVKK